MRPFAVAATAGTLLLLAAGTVLAQGAPGAVSVPSDDIIAARQSAFALMQGNVAAMKRAVDAKSDPKPFADAAKAIAMWGDAIPGMFPKGTESGHNTKAKPNIWTDNAAFVKDAGDLHTTATKLAEAAQSGDQAAFATAFGDTGKACGACHREFRAR